MCFSGTPAQHTHMLQQDNPINADSQNNIPDLDEFDDDDEIYILNQLSPDNTCKYKITICGSDIELLIDSGSSANIIDEQTFNQIVNKPILRPCSTRIFPYNANTPLKLLGRFETIIECNNNKANASFFVLQGKAGSILGKDSAIKLDLLRVGPPPQVTPNININQVTAIPSSTQNVINKHKEIFKGVGKLKDYQLQLHIDRSKPPVQQPIRRLPYHTRQKVTDEINRLKELDIIEPVNGPTTWVSPIVPVPKPNGKTRLCLDMRRPNESIIREKHQIPKLEEILPQLTKATVFSKIDLKEGYHQIELHPDSRDITTFITHEGTYRYKRLIYGINSAFEHFQKQIETVIANCPGSVNISDDIFIFGKTQEEHDSNLNLVLTKLQHAGLRLNPTKCEFSKNEIIFSGFKLTDKGIRPDISKVNKISSFKPPQSVKEVRSFLGLVNYCSKFIPNFSTITEPLRILTKKDSIFRWNTEQQQAFDQLKDILSDATTLAYYNPDAETYLTVDASPVGLGAILSQKQEDGSERPVAFGSKSLNATEQRYGQVEREALAVLFGCEHFHFFLYDKPFTINTDHKPLLKILSNNSSPPPRIQKWMLRLQAYVFKLVHKPGKDNPADYLSRSPSPVLFRIEPDDAYIRLLVQDTIPTSVSMDSIRNHTEKDTILSTVLSAMRKNSWNRSLKPYYSIRHELTEYNGVILKGHQIVIPKLLQSSILNTAHETHQGVTKTKALLREKVWWPTINSDIEKLIENCKPCQATTPATNKHQPLSMTKITKPWQQLGADLQGPYPTGEYLFVLIDYCSRYPIVIKLKSTTSTKLISHLESIFNQFGIPYRLITDNGPQFISDEFENYLKRRNIEHQTTLPYMPQQNGEVERFNRTLKRFIQAKTIEGRDWRKHLDQFLLDYRTTPHSTTGKAPATVLFGRNITNSIPSISQQKSVSKSIINADKQKKEKMKSYADTARHAKMYTYAPGTIVLVKNIKHHNKLTPPWNPTPHIVTKSSQHGVTVKNTITGNFYRRSNAHLRPLKGVGGGPGDKGSEQGSQRRDPLGEDYEPTEFISNPTPINVAIQAPRRTTSTIRLRRNAQGNWTRCHVMYPT